VIGTRSAGDGSASRPGDNRPVYVVNDREFLLSPVSGVLVPLDDGKAVL
jgi:hypothetical protein